MVEAGRTLGEAGPASGRVLRDEEHDLGARLTLEEGAPLAPYVITCVIEDGRFEHVFGTTESSTAAHIFISMKRDIEQILAAIAAADEQDVLGGALEQFVSAYR
jgi:hypothetical protein